MTKKTDSTLALAKTAAQAASKIKAENIKILDLRKVTSFADYFIIATGNSDRQVASIADSIIEELKKIGRRPMGVEGYEHSQWIIVDYGDIVAHIFYGPMREIYALEKIWADARAVQYRTRRPKRQK